MKGGDLSHDNYIQVKSASLFPCIDVGEFYIKDIKMKDDMVGQTILLSGEWEIYFIDAFKGSKLERVAISSPKNSAQ